MPLMKKIMSCFTCFMLVMVLFVCFNQNVNAACNHKWGSWKTVKSATCTKDGRKQRVCSKCHATTTSPVNKTGHKWSYTVTKKATCKKEGRKVACCLRCNAKESYIIPLTGHNWSLWVMRVPPTYTSKGVKKRTCSTCHAGQEAYMPKLTK